MSRKERDITQFAGGPAQSSDTVRAFGGEPVPQRSAAAFSAEGLDRRDTAASLLDSPDGRKIHFAIMAIESGARKLCIDGREMHDRLKAQNLIHTRLLGRYDTLHTQSRAYVADDIVETLLNWEADK